MFLLTQFIGLFVVNAYSPIHQSVYNATSGQIELQTIERGLPFGLETPKGEPTQNFISIVFAFAFAFAIIFVLIKYKWKFVIKSWFFLVIALALGISIYAIIRNSVTLAMTAALMIAVILSYIKVFRPNVFVHNITELLIYPGIAAVFIPILTPLSVIALLILISLYDMWAVWKSGIMQKMAKFQMEELKLFGGFLIPTASDKVKMQIKKIKEKYQDKKMPESVKKKKFKVNIAILGGGDVIFPIIAAGVFMRSYYLQSLFNIPGLIPALFVIGGAFVGLTFLFAITRKGKAYPAMPYITAGIFLGLLAWKFLVF